MTLRSVQRDNDAILAYARRDEIGLVMLFRYKVSTEADAKMRSVTEQLIDAALASDGSYYLPYRPHATIEQFREAYPKYKEFYALKQRYDPTELFQNSFYQDYIKPAAK